MVDWQPSQPRWQHFLLVTTVMIRGRDVESAAPMPGGRPPNPIVSNTIASESPAGHMGISAHRRAGCRPNSENRASTRT
ncbi:uncharacterized protein CCOS01_12583 [Colletotrichum costaricense]|uniref:Uncharacterized protein n=3 Tax=Colletotrichum acutatum species complex TaxID=2707335 RepID=A0AAI9YNN6_9PEZI|nr:uncharacterized protein CCOS01_12583 [Colletotrichum costaricense]XP_060377184.1 uncharacterized protein CTAM01_12158 [Colletotrichum tamarilloi]KAK1486433.1 hypothetical protein CTAM01_12158 [Colletotrichum tamarilloi]KAK1517034.1 hypothetical protein CCOS01_12583 [Colletotrichum costaricense]